MIESSKNYYLHFILGVFFSFSFACGSLNVGYASDSFKPKTQFLFNNNFFELDAMRKPENDNLAFIVAAFKSAAFKSLVFKAPEQPSKFKTDYLHNIKYRYNFSFDVKSVFEERFIEQNLPLVIKQDDITPLDVKPVINNNNVRIKKSNDVSITKHTKIDKKIIHDAIIAMAKKHGVDPRFALLIAKIESTFDPYAISESGAMGIMQLMPATAKEMGVTDPFDYLQNIEGGIKYIRHLSEEFPNPILLAAAYHSGAESVRLAGGVPKGKRTANYIVKVFNNYILEAQGIVIPEPITKRSKFNNKKRTIIASNKLPKKRKDAAPQWEQGMIMHLN